MSEKISKIIPTNATISSKFGDVMFTHLVVLSYSDSSIQNLEYQIPLDEQNSLVFPEVERIETVSKEIIKDKLNNKLWLPWS